MTSTEQSELPHHHHEHAMSVTKDSQRRVFWIMILTGTFMLVEAFGGWFSGSLALVADAGHMFSDTAAMGLAWGAFALSVRTPDDKRTYGYARFQIFAALINSLMLFGMTGWIIVEAVKRFVDPAPVMGTPMLVVAVLGLLINVFAFWILHRGDAHNVNMRGALLHVLGDLLGSVAAIVAAVVIMWTGWFPIDPILSIFVALLILRSAWFLARETVHILMEGAPEDLNPEAVGAYLVQTVDGVENVHHVHIWSLTQEQPLATMHVRIQENVDDQRVLLAVKSALEKQFGLAHTTIQIERSSCAGTSPCTATSGTHV